MSFIAFNQAHAIAIDINVPADHITIQDAINAANPGDTIIVADGTYPETLDVNKSVIIQGQSQAGVIIAAPDVNDYAIDVQSGVNSVTIENVTMTRPSTLNCTPANTSTCFGLKVAGGTGHTFQNITVTASPRTGIDLNGVDNTNISNVTVTNSTYGAGLAITDSDNIAVNNITTSGNSFGGIGIFSSGGFFPPAGSSMTVTGTISIAENNKIYYQKTAAGQPITVTATGFNFVILDNTPGSEQQGFLADTLPNAIAGAQLLEAALGNNNASSVVVQDLNNPATTYPDSDPLTAGYQSGDTTAPVLDTFTFVARDALDIPKTVAADGNFYLTAGEKIYYTVNLSPDDTVAAGNTVDFLIGATPVSTTAFVQSATPVSSRNRNYTIAAGENGSVSITGLTFNDQAGNALTNAPTFPLTTNLIIDTTAPSITSVTQTTTPSWGRYVKAGETVSYTINYNEPVTVSVNTASSAANATGAITEVSASNASTDSLVVTVQAGDNGEIIPAVDFNITDLAGNTTNITSLGAITGGGFDNKVFADTTVPTLTSVTMVSDNANNTAWAKTGDTVTVTFAASEELINNNTTVTVGGRTATLNPQCGGAACTNFTAALTLDGTETEGDLALNIAFNDRAQNDGVAVTATTDSSKVTFDKTAPTIPAASIASNNTLDTTLAKTSDTITVTATINDNLSSVISLVTSSILNKAITANTMTATGAGKTISRLTDGTETSEVTVPFTLQVADIAGNISTLVNNVTDGSSVVFDRTDPVTRSIKISATSADGSAYTADAPTYYAKQGDEIKLIMHICDYVDSDSNPPTGTFFGQAITMTDQGLVGAPGNCTTGEGNPSQWRNWRAILTNVDGAEGEVTFNITAKDNAGNQVANITGTTDNSKVIFDKTVPLNPTDVVDLGGAQNNFFKPVSEADYTWTNDSDPMGGNPVSGIQAYDIRYYNPNTGINESVTIDAPTQAFTPTSVIPDNDPYEVFMSVVDKAGNASTEATTYTQKYGITISGTVTEAGSNSPLSNTSVVVISEFGNECQPGSPLCAQLTDANGQYEIVVAPNKNYIVDFLNTPNHYLAKEEISTTTNGVTMNASLNLVEYPEIQASQQTILITTENSVPVTNEVTQILVDSYSGEITTTTEPGKIIVTSFGEIVQIRSNNPDVVITGLGNNAYEITGAGNLIATTDLGTQSNQVSTSFASGATKSATTTITGGPSINSFNGIRREDRLNAGIGMTYRESLAHAQKMNEGAPSQTNQYVNRNGYVVFGGYQSGTLGLDKFKRFDHRDYIVFRGQKTGSRQMQEFANNQDGAPQLVAVKKLFKETGDENTVVIQDGDNTIIARTAQTRVSTIKGQTTKNMPGYGKKVSDIDTAITKRIHEEYNFNPYYRAPRENKMPKSRIQPKAVNQIYIRHGRKKVAMGNLFGKPEDQENLVVSQ